MAGSIKVKGLSGLRDTLGRFTKKQQDYVVSRRYDAMSILLEAMMENIPVWTGRTIRSIRISTTGVLAPLEPHPEPSEWAKFGRTSQMSLGSEPMRSGAESIARAQLANAKNARFADKLYLTVNSTAWDLVENAAAPGAPLASRNRAVVSEIAKAKVRSSISGVS